MVTPGVLDELNSRDTKGIWRVLARDKFDNSRCNIRSQGYGDNMFYWSDIFHYRKTYQFARQLFKNATDPSNADLYAKTEQLQAFALGWMSHCATDVIGHSFVPTG